MQSEFTTGELTAGQLFSAENIWWWFKVGQVECRAQVEVIKGSQVDQQAALQSQAEHFPQVKVYSSVDSVYVVLLFLSEECRRPKIRYFKDSVRRTCHVPLYLSSFMLSFPFESMLL